MRFDKELFLNTAHQHNAMFRVTKWRLSLLIMFVTGVIIVTEWMRHYHWKEISLVHQIQENQNFIREVWGHCFRRSNFNNISESTNQAKIGDQQNKHDVINGQTEPLSCRVGFVSNKGKCVPCPRGTFALEQWVVCVPLLSCDDFSYAVQVGELLYSVGNWMFSTARWNNYDVMYAVLTSSGHKATFEFDSIQTLFPHNNILYPIGVCNREGEMPELLFVSNTVVLGSASYLDTILSSKTGCENKIVRFKLAMDYIKILFHLHSKHKIVNREVHFVLCNSHSLSLLLSQFLVTSDFELVLGALDNLSQVDSGADHDKKDKVLCSLNELSGDFIAPEQEWPHQSSKVFNPTLQPGYTEKADIWKIPDVTRAIMGKEYHDTNIFDLLQVVHRACKATEPSRRPTAEQVLYEYQFAWKLLTLS